MEYLTKMKTIACLQKWIQRDGHSELNLTLRHTFHGNEANLLFTMYVFTRRTHTLKITQKPFKTKIVGQCCITLGLLCANFGNYNANAV